ERGKERGKEGEGEGGGKKKKRGGGREKRRKEEEERKSNHCVLLDNPGAIERLGLLSQPYLFD
ncbi:hypothetical protein, partial [Streptococcus parasanguinis]|uniref:hypothetical protein n=1 Tax=Streptococcus parasanguinis TaxID=1318 RepID=UPI0004E1E665